MSYEPHTQTPLSTTHFDDNNKKYRLCCCHVKTWTLVIGIIELIGLLIQVASTIANYVMGRNIQGAFGTQSLAGMIVGIIFLILGIIVVVLLIQGVRKIKPNWLIPHMIWQVLSILAAIIAAICYFVVAGTSNKNGNRNNARQAAEAGNNARQYSPAGAAETITGVTVGGGIGLLITAAISAFFLYVVFRCYKYLKEKVAADDAVPMSSGYEKGYAAVEKGGGRHIS